MGKLQRPMKGQSPSNHHGDKSSKSNTFELKKRDAVAIKNPIASKADDALGDIFLQLKGSKKGSASASATPQATSGSTMSSSSSRSTAPKPSGDGLYRAKSQTVEMGDDAFFGSASGVPSGATKKKASKKNRDGADAPNRKRSTKDTEGVDQLITEDELLKITSSKPEAGTTPNCPFDCDCCF